MDMSTPVGFEKSTIQINQANETVGPLAEQSMPPPVVGEATTLRSVSKMLQRENTHTGVLIRSKTGGYVPIYSNRTFLYLARPFAKDLYYNRPVSEFARQHHASEPLTISAETSISDAIETALQRDPNTRYDPILVRLCENEPPRMIDVRSLLERQRKLLGMALSAVESQRQEAYFAATHDRLTGLPNRPNAMSHLAILSSAHQVNPQHNYAVLFLDFDRFKLINDSLGHDAGDELLIQISKRLRETFAAHIGQTNTSAESGMTARLGGDEFLVLIDRLERAEEAEELAEQIIQAMRPPFRLRGYEVSSSPSIGVATSQSSDGTKPDAIVRDADTAMYRAKAQGRARYVVFDHSMQDEALERLYIESQLRNAVELSQFQAYYQPIVNCETGEVAGFEALARWFHPELGFVSPGKFIPIAEECGAISAIGRFMLEQAIHQLAQWNRKTTTKQPLYMSINVSKRQLLKPGFIEHLKQTLSQNKVDPKQVYLEVTETVVIGHGDTIVNILQECKTLGVQLSMDDFGAGLSSLTHLHKYPVDVLKIDQAFVKHLEENSIYTAVVLAIVTLAKNLGMSIVVEGIERVEQLVQIQTLDCEYAQGYLFSKPVPAAEAAKLIELGKGGMLRCEVA